MVSTVPGIDRSGRCHPRKPADGDDPVETSGSQGRDQAGDCGAEGLQSSLLHRGAP